MPQEEYDELLAKKASERVEKVECYVALIGIFFLFAGALLHSYAVAFLAVLLLIGMITWEVKYDKKYHFSKYDNTKNRINRKIMYCPFCGSDKLDDTNLETICSSCNKKFKKVIE